VIADFISGAVEWVSPNAPENHWDLLEGQGSLFHPAFAGVSMGLLHGAQADAFVVCHEPTRTHMRGVKTPIPLIQDVIDLTIRCGRLTNPDIRCVGLAVNTAALGEEQALGLLDQLTEIHEFPATDPIRFGVDPIIDQIARDFPNR